MNIIIINVFSTKDTFSGFFSPRNPDFPWPSFSGAAASPKKDMPGASVLAETFHVSFSFCLGGCWCADLLEKLC